MKKSGILFFILLLGGFTIIGFGYSVRGFDRAEAESVKTVNPNNNNNNNNESIPLPTNREAITEPDIKPGESLEAQAKYYLDVSLEEQKLRIYQNGELIKEWIVSTGANDATPTGRFNIQNRGEWFFSNKYQQGAKWWVSFKDWGVYLFHTVPMDSNQNIIEDEAEKLGKAVSHGCVRLEVENAKWIYDNIPQGSEVYIH